MSWGLGLSCMAATAGVRRDTMVLTDGLHATSAVLDRIPVQLGEISPIVSASLDFTRLLVTGHARLVPMVLSQKYPQEPPLVLVRLDILARVMKCLVVS